MKNRPDEARLPWIVSKYGPQLAAMHKPQMEMILGTMLYAADLTWSGQRGIKREYQRVFNGMGRFPHSEPSA